MKNSLENLSKKLFILSTCMIIILTLSIQFSYDLKKSNLQLQTNIQFSQSNSNYHNVFQEYYLLNLKPSNEKTFLTKTWLKSKNEKAIVTESPTQGNKFWYIWTILGALFSITFSIVIIVIIKK